MGSHHSLPRVRWGLWGSHSLRRGWCHMWPSCRSHSSPAFSGIRCNTSTSYPRVPWEFVIMYEHVDLFQRTFSESCCACAQKHWLQCVYNHENSKIASTSCERGVVEGPPARAQNSFFSHWNMKMTVKNDSIMGKRDRMQMAWWYDGMMCDKERKRCCKRSHKVTHRSAVMPRLAALCQTHRLDIGRCSPQEVGSCPPVPLLPLLGSWKPPSLLRVMTSSSPHVTASLPLYVMSFCVLIGLNHHRGKDCWRNARDIGMEMFQMESLGFRWP